VRCRNPGTLVVRIRIAGRNHHQRSTQQQYEIKRIFIFGGGHCSGMAIANSIGNLLIQVITTGAGGATF
jgi:hypothetical protein